jgi:phytanoyl-CoA hydroxylase
MSAAATDLVARFLDEGYAIVEDVFDPADGFRACRAEWSAILDRIESGLPAAAGGGTFDQRLTAACAAAGGDILQAFDISLPQREIRTETPLNVGPAMFALITDERLLDIVEELVGPEILSSPVQHVRFKTPNGAARDGDRPSYLSAAVPWHQDLGVLLPEADASSILSCWIAVTDADEENGCMQVVPRSHRLPLLEHCPAGQVAIPDRLVSLAEARSLPMRAGSVLLFGQNLVHSSLENTSRDRVRISVDLRFQRPDEPTGRPDFPGFVARSRAHPERVLRDPSVWAASWHAARARLATDATPAFNRWDTDSPACA